MSKMNTLQFALTLFKKASQALGIKFVKTTAPRLEMYAQSNTPPFLALVGLNENLSRTVVNKLNTYDLAFVLVLEMDVDPSNDKLNEVHGEASDLAARFVNMVEKNHFADTDNVLLEDVYRLGTFAGIGKTFTMSLTLPDSTDYCQDDCKISTVNIGCDEE